jgi:peptide/nickel transport system substrate-binding protein
VIALRPVRRAALAALLALPSLAAAGVRPAYGGEVRIQLPAPPRQADPAQAVDASDLALVRALHATPLTVDESGRLAPGLLEEVPAPAAGGRAFRLRLRPGLRFADGSPLVAADLAASLTRLLGRDVPNAWVALPVLGADAFLAGRAATLAGLQVLSDRELLVTLAFPLPEWPWALAAPAAAVVSPRGGGAGPFQLLALDAAGARLAQNPLHWRGRPYADRLVLTAGDARAAARALSHDEVDLALRPEATAPAPVATPALLATVAAVNERRLGDGAEAVRRLLASLDRGELARRFARGPAAPLACLVPPALLPPPEPLAEAAAAPGRAPARLVLLAGAATPDQRAVAERIQVRLFDAGVRAALEVEAPARFAARLAAQDYDVALVAVPVQPLAPALAAGQVALAARGPEAALRAMAALSGPAGLPPAAAAEQARALGRALDLWPVLATGARASAGPGLEGLRVGADGGIDPGDLWRRRGATP